MTRVGGTRCIRLSISNELQMTKIEAKPLSREHIRAFLALYCESFPSDERRDYPDAAALSAFMEKNKHRFYIRTIVVDDSLAGFITYWDFGTFGYVEHLAVSPSLRCEGLGSLLLADLLDDMPRLILEVERPDDDPDDKARSRRIRFYRRHEFKLHPEVEYLQPPYAAGKAPLPMLLATSGHLEPTPDVIDTIRRYVYLQE